jgi:hypothetical protein
LLKISSSYGGNRTEFLLVVRNSKWDTSLLGSKGGNLAQ